ncbi:hypothetical protein BRD19_08145 [Halobacteriales archaeon SW_7_65_23]|nr:MAG: hypothetical protein BRD19_08145 [Halobacteriales archaeon SW_7_65_23]
MSGGDDAAENPVGGPAPARIDQSDLAALFGRVRWRTAVGGASLVVAALLVVVALVAPQWLFKGEANAGLVPLFDGFVGVAIVLVGLSTVAGVGYGLWNGGPVLAYAMPTLPWLIGGATAGGSALTVDAALALSGGAAAATASTYSVHRVAGRLTSVTEAGLALATGGTVVAAVALWRVRAVAGGYASTGLQVATALLAVTMVTLVLQVVFTLDDVGDQQS